MYMLMQLATASLSAQKVYLSMLCGPRVFVQVNPAHAAYYAAEQTDDGGCSLTVLRVNYQSAGTYTCQHHFDQGSASLIILSKTIYLLVREEIRPAA